MRTLVTLGFFITICLISPNLAINGLEITSPQKIEIDSSANFQITPKSFTGTEDNIFLFPDYREGTIKVFSKEGSILKYITFLGRHGIGQERFARPKYLFYSSEQGRLGVIDFGSRRVYIYDRIGKIDFKLIKDISCKRLGDDIEFAGNGTQFIISGYLADNKGTEYDLYSIDIEDAKIDFLLESYKKYGLGSPSEYKREYDISKTIPAVGIASYITILGDNLFFVYEGSPRIIKINLNSKESTSFGVETPNYNKPDAARLAKIHKKGDESKTWEEQKRYTYIRNIFATSGHIFSIYEIVGRENSPSKFRAQIYDPEGQYINDISIPGSPGKAMWMDKEGPTLYSIADDKVLVNEGKFSVLKYNIHVNSKKKFESK